MRSKASTATAVLLVTALAATAAERPTAFIPLPAPGSRASPPVTHRLGASRILARQQRQGRAVLKAASTGWALPPWVTPTPTPEVESPASPRMKVVLTAFGPFEGMEVNPTQQLLDQMQLDQACADSLEGCSFEVMETSAFGALEHLQGLQSRSEEPHFFLHLGVNSKATKFNVECRAFNEAHFPVPDVRQFKAYRRPITLANGIDHCLLTEVDVDGLVGKLQGRGWDVTRSDDAGRYVCNWVYFHSLTHCQASTPGERCALFLHVPPTSLVPLEQQQSFLVDLLRELTAVLPLDLPGLAMASTTTTSSLDNLQSWWRDNGDAPPPTPSSWWWNSSWTWALDGTASTTASVDGSSSTSSSGSSTAPAAATSS